MFSIKKPRLPSSFASFVRFPPLYPFKAAIDISGLDNVPAIPQAALSSLPTSANGMPNSQAPYPCKHKEFISWKVESG
ncbi:hypothetical protein SAMN05216332_10975 [Nitrosospira briensis]|nr:hypothetical protein SAMN05216332_10975 [Nitrosospira briensis]